ncbi:Glycosyltransferase 28 domain protein [Desulfatibacillum aliphaticivorans]|uniref:Glycosyltransferase 28 domain protein n=1 Tax=Desulfatibacillum aliphaticivorans TaxID=218208 RepID=B8FHJ8_DESAL|nr:glycosyltransferase [Desulfatibacillum aliphaticivorans]ACL02286.1 Glycosyltransferase 28 domain protein [Desulfatibacillum aliphaticivorans]
MKILFYCQHVLGMGHFFRSLEIIKAFSSHEVILVSGGPPVDAALPPHVREVRLPGLAMDEDFSRMYSLDPAKGIEEVKQKRVELLGKIFSEEKPDLFLVELYPFGRKAFRFELDPILAGIRRGDLPPCKVVCSLRDILVEKKDPSAYESRVTSILNSCFDGLAVHADPSLVGLDDTFTSMDQITIPVRYTGFVTPKPRPGAGEKLRKALGLGPEEKLIVVSAGGGKVGAPLLEPVEKAFLEKAPSNWHMHVFTGPFLDDDHFERLTACSNDHLVIERFSDDFLTWLDAADLSISMAGYNTCMNTLAAHAPALVLPFEQNREQLMRARKLEALGALEILEEAGLKPDLLIPRMQRIIEKGRGETPPINLNGAAETAAWAESLALNGSGDGC